MLERSLFLLIHDDALSTGLLFGLGLLGGHGLVDPLVGLLQIVLTGRGIVALQVSPLAVHQIHVGHSVVVVGTNRQGFGQVVDAILDVGRVLVAQHGANFLVLQRLFRLQAQLGAFFHAGLVGLSPIDDPHRVVRLGIVGIGFERLAV